MRILLSLILAFSAVALAKERDFLGLPFDSELFPLCRAYGCQVSRSAPLSHLDGGTVHLQLLRTPAKLHLYLAPDQSVMGLTVLVPGNVPSEAALNLVQHTVNNAAQQSFDPSMLPRCLKKTRLHFPKSGNVDKRGIILTHNHYGVQCIVKRFDGFWFSGALVFFDL